MLWKQFLTPVASIDAEEARERIANDDDLQLLDVRQPGEYNQEHIPGSILMPMAEVMERKKELDSDKPVLVYCASGGRSRVAAQMLAGQGFSQVLNLSGGIKAWNGWTGFGLYDEGLEIFEDMDSIEKVLDIAYGMESALQEYYSDMAGKVGNQDAAKLFKMLADIETKHKANVAENMEKIAGKQPPTETDGSLEGGRPTEDYVNRLALDLEQPQDVVEFAMAIEAQALDLYGRAANNEKGPIRDFLLKMAEEEKGHLKSLGKLMDSMQQGAA